jgi:predicted RNase H-like nuclease
MYVGRWEVPPAWIIDNCSNEVHYTVEVEQGTVLGDETSGYVVVNMPEGIYKSVHQLQRLLRKHN